VADAVIIRCPGFESCQLSLSLSCGRHANCFASGRLAKATELGATVHRRVDRKLLHGFRRTQCGAVTQEAEIPVLRPGHGCCAMRSSQHFVGGTTLGVCRCH
jgi:hypothetical protein